MPLAKRVTFFLVLFGCQTDSACLQECRHASTGKNVECSLRSVTPTSPTLHWFSLGPSRKFYSVHLHFSRFCSSYSSCKSSQTVLRFANTSRHSLTSKNQTVESETQKRWLLTASCLEASMFRQSSVDLPVRIKQHLDTKNVLEWTKSENRRLRHFLVSLLQLLVGSETSILPHRQRNGLIMFFFCSWVAKISKIYLPDGTWIEKMKNFPFFSKVVSSFFEKFRFQKG